MAMRIFGYQEIWGQLGFAGVGVTPSREEFSKRLALGIGQEETKGFLPGVDSVRGFE